MGCAGSLSRSLFSSMVSRGLLCSCRVQASHCCGAQALGLTGFRGCSTWAQQLWVPISRAQAQWLWHTHLVGIFPNRRLNLNWQADSLPPSHQGNPGNLSWVAWKADPKLKASSTSPITHSRCHSPLATGGYQPDGLTQNLNPESSIQSS